MQIYLDYSATTPTRPEAIALMQQVMTEQWGNPSSLHQWGGRAATAVEKARFQVADLLNAPSPDSIVFTSGGTESDNLAIMGIAQNYVTPQHIIISDVEHSAVTEPARRLQEIGWQVTKLPADRHGRVNPEDLRGALQDNTVLVSIIFGQSEVGTVQPIEALGHIAQSHGAIFHTDAVQVAGRIPIDVQSLPVDLLSLSSHKLYGPQGIGALYIKAGVSLQPLLRGGGQEFKLRSGTQAVPLIAGFGLAASLAAQELPHEVMRLRELRDRLFDRLANVEGLEPTGDRLHRLPHHASFVLRHADGTQLSGKTLVRQLNLAGIAASSGSACHSGKLAPSPILLAMGYPEMMATGGVRLSLGKHTLPEDIDWVGLVFKQILERCQPALAFS
ncbi:MAG: cysteine desulfurase family protein [Cyanobacteria bacterium P01_F01_bin.150]